MSQRVEGTHRGRGASRQINEGVPMRHEERGCVFACERMCVCECVCVCARERESVCACV